MQNEIYEWLEDDVTFVTPTQRLSRHLRFQHAQHQIQQGHTAWRTPDCLPWSAWCKRTFFAISQQGSKKTVLITQLQQQWLWQDIIAKSRHKNQLLQTGATARQVAYSYQVCREWQIPVFPEEVYLSEDAFAFRDWVNNYEKQKQDQHWLDDTDLPEFIADNIAELKN